MWHQGILQLSTLQLALVALILTHITIVSVTVYLHRYSAHRALQLNGGLKHFFRFWLWLTTGIKTQEWTAIHRKHHAHCETETDPHSPVVKGLGKVFWNGTELYKEAGTPETLDRYGRGTPDDWLERHVYQRNNVGITLMLAIDLMLFGAIGLTVWAVQMVWIPLFAAGVINGVGHAKGYRNFECPDAARNIVPWGILIGGEELHNNHHTYPNSPKLSVKWWELDIGWQWIKLFRLIGLARVKQLGPIAERVSGKHLIDLDTAWATVNDRFHIMAEYSRKVVTPLVQREKTTAGETHKTLLRRAKRLLIGEPSLIGDKEKHDIRALLNHYPSFERVYEMRRALDDIWRKGAHNSTEIRDALTEWCRQAEESGIEALREFAAYLRTYSMPGSFSR
jgi:fatty-acid desaturase